MFIMNLFLLCRYENCKTSFCYRCSTVYALLHVELVTREVGSIACDRYGMPLRIANANYVGYSLVGYVRDCHWHIYSIY